MKANDPGGVLMVFQDVMGGGTRTTVLNRLYDEGQMGEGFMQMVERGIPSQAFKPTLKKEISRMIRCIIDILGRPCSEERLG